MTKLWLDEELWSLIQPVLPSRPTLPQYAGRKPLDNRGVLTGILFVLYSGIPWQKLPAEFGCGSGKTCWRRLRVWQATGVWDAVQDVIRAKSHACGRTNWLYIVAECSSSRSTASILKSYSIPSIVVAPKHENIPTQRDFCQSNAALEALGLPTTSLPVTLASRLYGKG